ncbi:DUF1345 domain-containing protein [Novosphingobium colocasiae]|uniref:DUF1345 domain-containing protein n=1 Tax=Novosphingobium colocasiae TaxID=1256513 RepID=A0A918PJC9_9SPHN|nr:DUF1345 domain-containing protein [Novosphingobium colocasiae]GGZ10472.1 hypothetical protein GCM10011614_26740 [Novosphingobium colocasiae]
MTSKIKHPRYILFLAVFAISGPAFAALIPWGEALVAGFDLAVLVFILSCVPLWRRSGPDAIRRQAERDDAGQVMLLLLSGVISVVALAALTQLILEKQVLGAGEIALLVCTLLASWTFTNLVLTFHYARLYYTAHDGGDCQGLDFPGDDEPDFSDFVNFAFVIGMTCQTADIEITGRHMRRVATFHGLFAFAFNLGILALTVNVLASGAG